MKKNFKFIFMIISAFLLVGCLFKMTPKEKVEELLSKYVKNDQDILKELDIYMDKQELSTEQKERYKKIIKDEYASIKYNIKDETIDGDAATVEVELEVKDLYKAGKDAESYLFAHPTEFYTDGVYDSTKFIDYKLHKMEKIDDTVTYTIYINLFLNDDGVWKIEELDEKVLEKIHGIYNYEADE